MANYSKRIEVAGKSADELYNTATKHLDELLLKPKVQALLGKVGVSKSDAEKKIVLDSKLVNATLRCEPGAFVLEGKLSLMALPFRSKIDGAIETWLKKVFG